MLRVSHVVPDGRSSDPAGESQEIMMGAIRVDMLLNAKDCVGHRHQGILEYSRQRIEERMRCEGQPGRVPSTRDASCQGTGVRRWRRAPAGRGQGNGQRRGIRAALLEGRTQLPTPSSVGRVEQPNPGGAND